MPLNRAFLDIRVFNPLAQSNWHLDINNMYKHHEQQKKREYNDRILQVEKGTFSPIVFSCTGGAGPEASAFIKRIALMLSQKKNEAYSDMVSYVRRRFSFDIVRSCVISFRGERGHCKSDGLADLSEIDFALTQMEGEKDD